MEKYKLSSRGLQRVFNKLVDSGSVTSADLSGRSMSYDDSVTLKKVRIYKGASYCDGCFALIGVIGRIRLVRSWVVAALGRGWELKTLVCRMNSRIEPFLRAKCQWSGWEQRQISMRDQITDISEAVHTAPRPTPINTSRFLDKVFSDCIWVWQPF
jgi:hypothetical protein